MNRNRLIEALLRVAVWISAAAIFVFDAAGVMEPLPDYLEILTKTFVMSIATIAAFFSPKKITDRELNKGLKWLDRDNDKAVMHLEKYLDSGRLKDMDRRNGLRILGVAHHKRGDNREAIRCLNQALEGHYSDNDLKVEILGAMGMIYSESGEYQKAVEHFERTFEIIFATSKAHIDKAALILAMNTYINADQKEKAVIIYDRLLMMHGFKRDKRVEELLEI